MALQQPLLRTGIGAALLLVLTLHAAVAWWLTGRVASGDATATSSRAPERMSAALLLVPPRMVALRVPPVVVDAAVLPERAAPARSPAPWRVAPLAPAAEPYASSRELDRGAMPRSAPDISLLTGLPLSGLPMRLRLFIDRSGTVDEVKVLQASEDEAVLAQVRRMFLATGFVAGRLHGVDVASYKDIEITLAPAQ
jgi:hypothetical protein